jgi:hypothetical protein
VLYYKKYIKHFPVLIYCYIKTRGNLLWIPEPSTESFTDSVLKPLILFCDWRGLIKESPPLNQSLRDVSIYYLLSKALESRVAVYVHTIETTILEKICVDFSKYTLKFENI